MANKIFVGLWSVYQKPQRRKSKPQRQSDYIKPFELAKFECDYNLHAYDNLQHVPQCARVRTRFRDDTANELAKAILAHLKYTGNFGARVNTTGVYDRRTGKYRQTNARKGMADISAVISGKPVQIEIKAGTDKPRADQLKVQEEYRAAGGLYEFVHNFREYIAVYRTLTGKEDFCERMQQPNSAVYERKQFSAQ